MKSAVCLESSGDYYKTIPQMSMRQKYAVSRHPMFIPLMFVLLTAALSGCAGYESQPAGYRTYASRPPAVTHLQHMGYAIQAGAFSIAENAAHLADILTLKGLDATWFKSDAGLFKVRFGNFHTRNSALQEAKRLKASGIIEAYYIVSPEEYAVNRQATLGGAAYLRNELVQTTRSFIGVPYLWGGCSPDTGFDCSGLAMTVYQLNGLHLPRTSTEQYAAGYPVPQNHLKKGDLVFFSSNKWGTVTHVGVYAGNGRFIHAPGRGKKIRSDSLSARYYKQRFIGARSYLSKS
jgi:hypothetical protein